MVEQSLMHQNLLKQTGFWLLLLACSLPLCWLLHEEGLPAAFLIGSILSIGDCFQRDECKA